jgi:hypothetical protein
LDRAKPFGPQILINKIFKMSQKVIVEIDDSTFELAWRRIEHLGLLKLMCEETEDDIVEAPLTGVISNTTFSQI